MPVLGEVELQLGKGPCGVGEMGLVWKAGVCGVCDVVAQFVWGCVLGGGFCVHDGQGTV